MLIPLHNLVTGGGKTFTTAGPGTATASARCLASSAWIPATVRSPAQARQYNPLALGHPCQARHELSSLALYPTKALPVHILGPAPGRRTQFDITIIDHGWNFGNTIGVPNVLGGLQTFWGGAPSEGASKLQ